MKKIAFYVNATKPSAPEAEGEQQAKKPRRRPNHRRHKPKTENPQT